MKVLFPIKERSFEILNRSILILGFLALVFIVTFFSNRFFWDEPYYYYNLDLLRFYGWGPTFLKNEWGSAGPLYTLVHYTFLPVTHAKLPNIRYINTCILLILIGLNAVILKKQLNESPWKSLLILAIPMTYVCGGIALTELPSFVFLFITLYLLFEILTKSDVPIKKYIFSCIAGIMFGIAISGRQPLMVSLFALPFIFLDEKFRTKEILISLLIFGLSALPFPFYIFYQWQGLLAPKEQNTTNGWSVFHFWMGMGYLSLVTFILAPKFYLNIPKKYFSLILGFCILVLLGNYLTKWIYYMPMVSFFYKIIPWSYSEIIASIFASFLILIGIYYVGSCAFRIYENRKDGIFIFISICILLIAFTSIKITHQYSSRYAFQAAPFIVLQLARFQKADFFQTLRFTLGITIGLISLYMYIG